MFNFAENLKTLRKSKGITQKQLAMDIGASERGIQNYEIGERKPTYDILIALADYFVVQLQAEQGVLKKDIGFQLWVITDMKTVKDSPQLISSSNSVTTSTYQLIIF